MIEQICGKRPVGWHTGRVSQNTRRLLREENGFLYSSNAYIERLFSETTGGLLGTLLIRHGLFPTSDADELRVKSENPSAEIRAKIGSMITDR